jgi:hypothetical protein
VKVRATEDLSCVSKETAVGVQDRDYMKERTLRRLEKSDIYYDPKLFRLRKDDPVQGDCPPDINYKLLGGLVTGFIAGFLFACLAALQDWGVFQKGVAVVFKFMTLF